MAEQFYIALTFRCEPIAPNLVLIVSRAQNDGESWWSAESVATWISWSGDRSVADGDVVRARGSGGGSFAG